MLGSPCEDQWRGKIGRFWMNLIHSAHPKHGKIARGLIQKSSENVTKMHQVQFKPIILQLLQLYMFNYIPLSLQKVIRSSFDKNLYIRVRDSSWFNPNVLNISKFRLKGL